MSRLYYKLNKAIGNPRDWSFTWAVHDDVTFSTKCGFCGLDSQRLSFEVECDTQSLWVCQRCVGRYAFGGKLGGAALHPGEARQHAHCLGARLKQRVCHDAILRAHASVKDPGLAEVAAYFTRNLQLSPRHAACLFSAMREINDTTDKRVFEIQTRSVACKREFGALDSFARALIWPALSARQKECFTALGYGPGPAARAGKIGYRRGVKIDHQPAVGMAG